MMKDDVHVSAARAIEALPRVLAAAVDLDGSSKVRSVFIATAASADAREVQEAVARIMDEHGLACRPEAIRIGVPRPSERLSASAPGGSRRRLLFAGLDVRRSGRTVDCRVQLLYRDAVVTGDAQELESDGGGTRAAARATLRAAETATGNVYFGLEALVTIDSFGRRHVAVSIEATRAGGDRRITPLCGVAIVERSAEEAACLATLNAIDRWVGGPPRRR